MVAIITSVIKDMRGNNVENNDIGNYGRHRHAFERMRLQSTPVLRKACSTKGIVCCVMMLL